MREFQFLKSYQSLLNADIVALIGRIHEFKGEQALFVKTKADQLSQLIDLAKIQSTEASNKIEGIYTSETRLKMIVQDKIEPLNRSEKEIAGYRDVLASIHDSHDYIPPKPSIILQLHRDLYKFSGSDIGGHYNNSDNLIAELDSEGKKKVRFAPVSAWETPSAMDLLCAEFELACQNTELDPLLLIPIFILDFLCIHPFNDGNGRLSRLLTLLLLYRSGYSVGKYISLEKLIEQTKESYYEALQESSNGWHEGRNDYSSFVRYSLGIVAAAYRDFSAQVQTLFLSGLSKPDRVREIIKGTLGQITKTEILQKCPDISQVTVQRSLNELLKSGKIQKLRGGRYSSYIWNRENE